MSRHELSEKLRIFETFLAFRLQFFAQYVSVVVTIAYLTPNMCWRL